MRNGGATQRVHATSRGSPRDGRISAGCGGTGSNSENSSSPARNPPICACQATACSPPGRLDRANAEQQVEPEPRRQENHDVRIAQRDRERRRRHPVGGFIAGAEHRERPAGLEHETQRARHEARDRRRSADHRQQLAPMGDEVRQPHRRWRWRRRRRETAAPRSGAPSPCRTAAARSNSCRDA